MRRLTVFVLAVCLVDPASAQVIEESKCWLGSFSFSPGSTANTGNGISLCSPDFTWVITEGQASGCIAAGEFYSVGAVENGPRADSVKMECKGNGVWQRLSE